MSIFFQINDPSLESQWRALILFGKNSATYKFALGKALLSLVKDETNSVALQDLAPLYVDSIINHLKENDKQGNSRSSTFLNACREYNKETLSYDQLINITVNHGFNNVIDAFQNINGGTIPNIFYEKDFQSTKNKKIVITDHLLELKESNQFLNFDKEVDARWNLVETAWNLKMNPSLLEVKVDEDLEILFLESNFMQRKNITSSRASLNGYQKGKCFYSFMDISLQSGEENICAVDHFFPHVHKFKISEQGVNINGIWNLVLADKYVNLDKGTRIPEIRFLERLYQRNEFYISSKHPLGETIINQTGKTAFERRSFLQKQYDFCLNLSIQNWKPKIENPPLF